MGPEEGKKAEVLTDSRAGSMQDKRLLALLVCLCLAAILVMIWALTRNAGQGNTGFVPPPFEEAAQQGEPEALEELERLGYSQLDVQVYHAAVCGSPVVAGRRAVLYLTNPAANQVWLKVRILDEEGKLFGESGLLKPGEYVKEVPLLVVPETDMEVQLKLMAYEPGTYHSAGAATLRTVLAGSAS